LAPFAANAASRSQGNVIWYFIFFFISGFCSVLYELIWLRLAMAQFGVTTAMVSIVLSVFMAGLGLGSWVSGRWLRTHRQSGQLPALRIYAAIEFLIGISGIVVPYALLWGGHTLGSTSLLSSFSFYVAAGLWVSISLIVWCALMGATIPIGMQAIRQSYPTKSERSFSYLYIANVAGAIAGTALPLAFIELFGFRKTLRIGTTCNFLIALWALAVSIHSRQNKKAGSEIASGVRPSTSNDQGHSLLLLFLTGLTTMALEVVWVRRYTPYVGTVVYAFASILSVYLVSTLAGSITYRRWSSRVFTQSSGLWIWLATLGLSVLVATSPHVHLSSFVRLLIGIAPFTFLLGWITPMLVDNYSGGDSTRAGKAYALNVVGCILGPLLAGFGLLPFLSERWTVVLLMSPWFLIGVAPLLPSLHSPMRTRVAVYTSLVIGVALIFAGRGADEDRADKRILRDSTATVIAKGTGFNKQLLVNGYGMTSLTPITKLMAHFPLASLDQPPQSALVICFGMGTTFRSLHSWGISATAVELVPSVPRMFSYYHSDADQILSSPLSHVMIDDGRRYLDRVREQYDLITIDPPPPLKAAASSLLYSEEFYRVARMRLRPGGILQQWIPTTVDKDPVNMAAVTRSLHESFPYVRAFEDEFGTHYLCSDRPIPTRSAEDLVKRMPTTAIADMTEWDKALPGGIRAEAFAKFDTLLQQEVDINSLIAASPQTPALTDDRPVNEYYALRKRNKKPTPDDDEQYR
jgi:spermidine synthase